MGPETNSAALAARFMVRHSAASVEAKFAFDASDVKNKLRLDELGVNQNPWFAGMLLRPELYVAAQTQTATHLLY